MVDLRASERDLGQMAAIRGRSRRGRVGPRRRSLWNAIERLEDRTLLSFTPIALPGDTLPNGTVYTTGTTNLASQIPADGTTLTSLTDGTETITFSDTLTAGTVPATWGSWNSPPATESGTPRVLKDNGGTSLTMTFSHPVDVFGFEAEPDSGSGVAMTATFMIGTQTVGSVPLNVNSTSGALLFAATSDQPFTSVVLSAPGSALGFAIAQPRYHLASPGPVNLTGHTVSINNDATDPSLIDFNVDGTVTQSLASLVTAINVTGTGAGNDLTVDSTNGPIAAPISYDGGGSGTLYLVDTSTGAPASSDTYVPGGMPGSGTSTIVYTGGTQTVSFSGLSPVVDTVPAGTLAVVGNDNNNTINYGDAGAGQGVVSVGSGESITFQNKAALQLNGEGGDDTYIINNTTTPTSLTTINVTGGSGNNTLVVNANNMLTSSADVTATNVLIPGATPVAVGYTGISQVHVINSTQAPLTGAATTINAAQGVPLNNALVGSFQFSDQPPAELAKATDFAATIDWGDGSPPTAGTIVALAPTAGGAATFQVFGSHSYTALPTAPATTFPVNVTVLDMGSSRTFVLGSMPVTITANPGATTAISPIASSASVAVAPIGASAGLTFKGVEGAATPSTTLIGTFTSADPAAAVNDFVVAPGSVVVDWGDGSAPQTLTAADLTQIGTANGATFEISAAHTYTEEGQFPVTITVTSANGAAAVVSATALIDDAPLSTTALVQPTINTTESAIYPLPAFGTPAFIGRVATFTDANPTAPLSDFTAVIDWGDGTAPTIGTVSQGGGLGSPFVVSGSHTYADSGVNGGTGEYPVTVNIQDVGGARLTVTNTAFVADRPIVLNGQVNPATVSGLAVGKPNITNINQPSFFGSSSPYSHVVLFATPMGGAPIQIASVQAGGNGSWSATSSMALPSNIYTVTASATDQFGQTTAGPVTIDSGLTVDTVAPVISDVSFDRRHSTLTVTYQDNLSGLDLAAVSNSAFYHISARPLSKKVHVPHLMLPTSITVVHGALPTDPVTATVVFFHGREARGGLYRVVINSGSGNNGIQDLAGNAMSGRYYGMFPTGDGRPGGDFVGLIATFHDKVFPAVPVRSGHVPPDRALDPLRGEMGSLAHKLHKRDHHAPKRAPKHKAAGHHVRHHKVRVAQHAQAAKAARGLIAQGHHAAHDRALAALIHDAGPRPHVR